VGPDDDGGLILAAGAVGAASEIGRPDRAQRLAQMTEHLP
jgi:hypothetical protein